MMFLLVAPQCTQRPAAGGSTRRIASTSGITGFQVTSKSRFMARRSRSSTRALRAISRAADFGHEAQLGLDRGQRGLHVEPALDHRAVVPDRPHRRRSVAVAQVEGIEGGRRHPRASIALRHGFESHGAARLVDDDDGGRGGHARARKRRGDRPVHDRPALPERVDRLRPGLGHRAVAFRLPGPCRGCSGRAHAQRPDPRLLPRARRRPPRASAWRRSAAPRRAATSCSR